LPGETEVLGENLHQRVFVYHKSNMTRPVFEAGPPRWEASDSLSYGAPILLPLLLPLPPPTPPMGKAEQNDILKSTLKRKLLRQISDFNEDKIDIRNIIAGT
jgi:hypothetical protein